MTDLRHGNPGHGNPGHKPHHDDLGFEREDLGGKPVFGFIVSLVISGVLIYYVIWGIFYFLDAYDKKKQPTGSPLVKVETNTRDVRAEDIQRFPEPRLEENERTEINDFRYGEEQELNSYGWVDQKAGVAHIPIDQAMQLIAQRGLPTTPQTGTVPFSPVNLAKAAAEASDTSDMQQAPAPPKGKKQ
jgi:hypothetical protein